MCVLLGTRDSSARNVLLVTKEIRPDWDLLAPVFHATVKGEGPVIQTQETVIQGTKTLTSSVPTAPSVSTTTRTTPAAASPAPVAMASAAP